MIYKKITVWFLLAENLPATREEKKTSLKFNPNRKLTGPNNEDIQE